MSGLQIAVAAGMALAGGGLLVVRGLRPAPRPLAAVLAQLAPAPARPADDMEPAPPRWLPASVGDWLATRVAVPDADLAVLGRSRLQLVARGLALALAGLLVPAALSLALAPLGVRLPLPVPVGLGVALAVLLWLLPAREARESAARARVEFRSHLEVFLTLVAGERRARGSVEQALEEAARVSDSAPFLQLRRALTRAALTGRKPWDDLRELGERLAVPELRNAADIAAVAADGAAVYATLLATARSLRHAELSDARAAANEVSERMSRPLAVLVTALTLFVLVPFMLRMFGATP